MVISRLMLLGFLYLLFSDSGLAAIYILGQLGKEKKQYAQASPAHMFSYYIIVICS